MSFRLSVSAILVFAVFPFLLSAQTLPGRRSKLPDAVREVSGMIRTQDGKVWLLNDSRNPPELFLFDPSSGALLETRRLPVPNRDWEDLAQDNRGNLYIGDFGNNRNARRDLCIFRYHIASGALDSIRFAYPDQNAYPPTDPRAWNFNCEAMVFFEDSLHLFSKNVFRGNFLTKHYVLPARPGRYVAILRDSMTLKNRVITGAALSPDGKTFAVTSYIAGKKLGFIPYTRATAYFFRGYSGSQFLRGRRKARRLPKCLIARQFESVTWWDENYWLIANEGRIRQRQAVWRIRNK
ncbi:MAG: hypothetical protein IPH12_10760 [Saprospirales bacterium]|jgi:hypothetical protein|nr:hypothetical protein [Saprospirales bacterium]MBK8922293.1 hypothetical protein [Saprospirales bacterium]